MPFNQGMVRVRGLVAVIPFYFTLHFYSTTIWGQMFFNISLQHIYLKVICFSGYIKATVGNFYENNFLLYLLRLWQIIFEEICFLWFLLVLLMAFKWILPELNNRLQPSSVKRSCQSCQSLLVNCSQTETRQRWSNINQNFVFASRYFECKAFAQSLFVFSLSEIITRHYVPIMFAHWVQN